MTSLVGRILGIALLLSGLWLSLSGLQKVRDAYTSKNWPTTEGEVLYSIVEGLRGGRNTIWKYQQKVHYAYSVNGKRYVGVQTTTSMYPVTPDVNEEYLRRVMRDPRGAAREGLAGGSVAGYPPGKKLTAYYKPDDPQVAVLEPGVSPGTFMALVLGIIIALVGLLATLGARTES